MVGLVSFGNKRTFEDFKTQINPVFAPLVEKIRDYCYSLGENVVEDVRMHRVVMCKSMTFRWFLDIEPQSDCIILKIQTSRKEPHKIIQVKSEDELNQAENVIKDAFEKIR